MDVVCRCNIGLLPCLRRWDQCRFSQCGLKRFTCSTCTPVGPGGSLAFRRDVSLFLIFEASHLHFFEHFDSASGPPNKAYSASTSTRTVAYDTSSQATRWPCPPWSILKNGTFPVFDQLLRRDSHLGQTILDFLLIDLLGNVEE